MANYNWEWNPAGGFDYAKSGLEGPSGTFANVSDTLAQRLGNDPTAQAAIEASGGTATNL